METRYPTEGLALTILPKEKTHPFRLEESSVIPWLNQILDDAIEQGASDIHFEPYEKNYRVRYRLDGLLLEIATPPLHLAARITARIKILANLDTAERRLPQDGRFHMLHAGKNRIDLRVSSCPTIHGEKIVIRILDAQKIQRSIHELGFTDAQTDCFLTAIRQSQGMIIITGPTGSGKTSTLYAALNLLNTIEKNIATVEDPVEIKLAGINQIQVNASIGLSFSKTLRALLRQDPDVIMVGEIRDKETAEIALKAAQTGHLVFSTLHTNSALEAFIRLRMMGVQTLHLVNSIRLVVAQRLVRCLCAHCKVRQELPVSPSTLKTLFTFVEASKEPFQSYRAVGCRHCKQGYRGRTGLFEVMPISPELQDLLMTKSSTHHLRKQAEIEGIATLSQVALSQVQAGMTTLEEIQRVLT